MADSIEEVMKKIHVLFSKCSVLDEKEEYIAVPKKQVFTLLEELNYAVYDLMENYEATKSKREMALKRQRDESERIMKEAADNAEDVYAASIIYTDRMLADIKGIIEDAKRDLYRKYESFASMMDEQLNTVGEDQSELRDQLMRMAHSKKYLSIINAFNEEERKREAEKQAEMSEEDFEDSAAEQEKAYIYDEMGINVPESLKNKKAGQGKKTDGAAEKNANNSSNIYNSGKGNKNVKSSSKKHKNNKEQADNAHRKDGNQEESRDSINQRRRIEDYDDFAEKKENRPIRKVASVTDTSVIDGKGLYNDEVKRVSYEVKVNPNYGSFETSPENLDAEYYQWIENGGDAISVDSMSAQPDGLAAHEKNGRSMSADDDEAAAAESMPKHENNKRHKEKKPGFLSRFVK